ncbi:hypothetical protein GCM10010169_49510 [Micromonospora fulviviridis]|uniref:hypothetical protein n=1 Tax=Micromonospora fulviviridis TaxID=47860 RepID=UPI00166D6B52|nr:hypothetical protein [Micromonospora fulviviridis]GGR99006.1 hypothetical protein GCM10010169_49510 [Micromonospora fulviviridis]
MLLPAASGDPDLRHRAQPALLAVLVSLTDVIGFNWAVLSAVRDARPDAVPEMVRHALRVLEDLLEEVDHA